MESGSGLMCTFGSKVEHRMKCVWSADCHNNEGNKDKHNEENHGFSLAEREPLRCQQERDVVLRLLNVKDPCRAAMT